MNLFQYVEGNGDRAVAVVDKGTARKLKAYASVYELALASLSSGSLAETIRKAGLTDPLDQWQLMEEGRILSPINHPDPTHLHITGTGLTHLGSASTRDAMHKPGVSSDEVLTDSMKMFRMGLDAGKPPAGSFGVQPEWFYKGNGYSLTNPGGEFASPAFALDAGEEPEVAGIYIIDAEGHPCRLGFALANEFSDHVMEKANYLYLAHSKLRPCAIGPELRLGPLPDHVEGRSRIIRGATVLWEQPFLSGENNMSHTIENLEYHHFKYSQFRQPGDVHIHMFGTATLSFADGVSTQTGDLFEIEAPGFGLPLRNRVGLEPAFTGTVREMS